MNALTKTLLLLEESEQTKNAVTIEAVSIPSGA